MSADHQRFDELAVGWALRALEPEDEAVFARHLPGCTRCTATVAETTEVMGALAADLPAVEPSDALAVRIREAVAATEQVDPAPAATPVPGMPPSAVPPTAVRPTAVPASATPAPLVPAPRRRPRSLALGLVAAAVAAVLGLGVWNVVLRSDRAELSSTVAAQQDAVEALLDPSATVAPLGDEGAPVATVVARDGELQVITLGLPANDTDDSTYVVWGLGGDAPEALGTFDVDGSQMALRTVESRLTGLDGFATYGISIEAGREAPSEPTEVVATGQVTS
ncbi:anti-sigma factor [Blastococcus litoris]|uniref:anti-sigma factor n=1 Tax=Blastococcus litoris TaxID=2171622 RepID=UPI000E30096D|nr:anti-sigma factor [Blastococcus litoris]